MIDSSTEPNIGAELRDFRLYGARVTRATLDRVSWHLRVVQTAEQRWECRFGEQVFDEHVTLEAGLNHTRVLAADYQPARIFVHTLNHAVVEAARDQPKPAA
jgi:hypothetical protein